MRHLATVLAGAWLSIAAAPPASSTSGASGAPGDEDGVRFAALLRDAAPSIVTIKVVTKTTIQGAESAGQEARLEISGVVVDAGGLVMTSILPFAPERLMKLLSRGNDKPQLTTVASDIEVLFEQDEREHGAFLAATDSNLGVAFLQIEALGGQKIKAVDFSHAGSAAIGDPVAAVSRLGKGYDSTPYFETARISGEISKPRRAWVMDHGMSTLGLPVFSPAGRVIGVLGFVDSGLAEGDSINDAAYAMGMRMLTGGGGLVRFFIVPAPAVAAVIDQARKQAAQKAADRAAKKAPPSHP